jgi:ArsR family transcriptional regulator, arsenate/arsenite/antimonite-responsive transcriptional repressor
MKNRVKSLPVPSKGLTEAEAADGFAALGNRARLRLLRLFVRAGDQGLNVGDAGRLMEMPASTLAHHLAALVRSGLVIQEKRGREVVCTADYAAIKGTAAYLTEACCAGIGDLAVESKAGVA